MAKKQKYPPWLQEILDHEGVTEEQKQASIQFFKEKSKGVNPLNAIMYAPTLKAAFIWIKTDQGHDFWQAISDIIYSDNENQS